MMNKKPLLITTGEPAGIGMDIVLDLAEQGYFASLSQPVVVTACDKSLIERAEQLQIKRTWQTINPPANQTVNQTVKQTVKQTASQTSTSGNSGNGGIGDDITKDAKNTNNENTGNACNPCDADFVNNSLLHAILNETGNGNSPTTDFYVLNIPTANPVVAGHIDVSNAQMVLKQLETAHQLAITKQVAGIVTAPLQKSALIEAKLTLPDGTMFSGHTEYFMQMSNCQKVVMMLANAKLKVALVTTHLPLAQVANAITKEEVKQTVDIVLASLQAQFAIEHPKVLVCGLNPHAGEGGHLGMEEIEIINPILQSFIDKGHDISLAMPADTLFTERYLAECDATIAMYHDQGLPVLKSHGFGDSVNLTLGLPYIRTSVDHGTALDLAGGKSEAGRASSDSLQQAVRMLVEMG